MITLCLLMAAIVVLAAMVLGCGLVLLLPALDIAIAALTIYGIVCLVKFIRKK